jgi:hypothetical protein
MELQKENRYSDHVVSDWAGSQLLLCNHSALGQLRRPLGRHPFDERKALRGSTLVNHCYEKFLFS